MGCGSWSSSDWKDYSTRKIEDKRADDIYSATRMKPEFDPKNATIRESCDSDDHPLSNPIIIGLDVTGSMGDILTSVANKLDDLVREIIDRKPVNDPQILFAAIGDSDYDECPLQVTQFESDIRIAEQLTDLYFESGGGPNSFESYPLVWYFAARHTKIDSFEKRNQKGFLFTMGDDCFPDNLTKEEIERVFGDKIQDKIPVQDILDEVNRKYEVFHLVLDRHYNSSKIERWQELIGDRVIKVQNYTKVPEIIVSILETMGGKDLETVVDSWDGSTAIVVKEALSGLTSVSQSSELVTF